MNTRVGLLCSVRWTDCFRLCVCCRYFFKRDSDEFGEGAVFEEIKDDNVVVPMWDGKIVARLQKVD